MSTTSILLNTTKQERVTRSKKSVKVVFLKYNKAEEEERHQKGLQLRKRLRKERERNKQYKKDIAERPQRVYNALLIPANAVLLNTLAINSLVFRTSFFIAFDVIVASPDNNIDNNFDGEPADFNRVLSRLIGGNVPFGNIGRIPDAVDALSAIGSLLDFLPFLNPPLVSSDSSVQSSNHSQGDDD